MITVTVVFTDGNTQVFPSCASLVCVSDSVRLCSCGLFYEFPFAVVDNVQFH